MPDQMMARTMRGKIREVTGASGATYRHADGSRWARIDGWWCMEGMAVTMDKRVDAMDLALDITHHRGVGVTWRMPDATTAAAGKGIRVMQRLPAKDDPKWGEYRAKLQREVATAMDEGTGPDGIVQAWETAARATFPTVKLVAKPEHGGESRKVPTLMPMTVWGPGPCGSKRMWRALREIRELQKITQPKLEEDGRPLSPEQILQRACERWGKLYQHPREREGWDEAEWRKKLDEVRETMATGHRIAVDLEPVDWETFRAYVRQLPDKKGGAGCMRNETFKYADEAELKVWYGVVKPAILGTWDPASWMKQSELVLVYKKGDGTKLEHFRGIGLLSHAFKLIEWALLAKVWTQIHAWMDEEVYGFIPNRGATQALWRIRIENDRRAREKNPWVWLSLDLQSCFDTVLREASLAAAEGLGIDPSWTGRWAKLWEGIQAEVRVAGTRGGRVAWQRGVVQGGVASPHFFAMLSLVFVRGIKQFDYDVLQVWLADDGLLGVRRSDLRRLILDMTRTYRGLHLDIAPSKAETFSTGGPIRTGDAEDVAGRRVQLQTDTMQQYGVTLPFQAKVKLSEKATKKVKSVLELWKQETHIPIGVCTGQFNGAVLGGIRHQQQAARLPAELEKNLQNDFEKEMRRMVSLGVAPSGEYIRAPRPMGLGLGSITLQGAVDFLMGLAQFRAALKGPRQDVLGGINSQLRHAGLCTRETIPQHGSWEQGRQTVLCDLMRSIGQLGVGIIWQEGTVCEHTGYHIVRDGYASRKREDCWTTGVTRIEVGSDVVLERWQMGKSSVWADDPEPIFRRGLRDGGASYRRQRTLWAAGAEARRQSTEIKEWRWTLQAEAAPEGIREQVKRWFAAMTAPGVTDADKVSGVLLAAG
eukprot:gene12816-14376_t